MVGKDTNTLQDDIKILNSFRREMNINGCKVTLNFLPESNGKSINTVKKMLLSSQYPDIPFRAD